MTVYPFVLSLGGFEITGYGLMMMVGFLMAGWAIQRRLRERAWNEDYAADIVVAAVVGGIVGAKLWYVVLYQDLGSLFSRGGLVWYGGFLGGFVAVLLMGMYKRVPTRVTMDLCAPGIAIGYALGRVGCFLVQDDYGRPTDVPWAMRFPQGLPPSTAQRMSADFGVPIPEGVQPFDVLAVHPTQLYEVAAILVVFWLLWRLRAHRHGTGWLMGLYLLLGGAERFLVEILRAKDDRFIGVFTVAQLTSVAMVTAGLAMMVAWSNKKAVPIPADAAIAKPARA